VNGFRRTPLPLLHVLTWLFVAALSVVVQLVVAQPVAAQVAPPPTNSLPGRQSPLGDLTSLTGDAKVWLQDLMNQASYELFTMAGEPATLPPTSCNQ